MIDRHKTKQSLIEEMALLKQRIAELEEGRPDSRQLQLELEWYRERLQIISNNAPFGIVLIDAGGRFININAKFTEMFGYDLNDVADGRTWFKRAFPDAAYRHLVVSAWLEDFKDAKPGEQKPRIFDVTCKDGTNKIIDFVTSRMESGDFLLICMDTTARKEAEKALRESEEIYRTLVDTSPDSILMYALDGTILTVSRRLFKKYGVATAAEFLSEIKNVLDVLAPGDKAAAAANFKRIITGGTTTQQEYLVRLRDGSYLPVEINSSLLRSADGVPRAIISVVRDITERKLAEEELRDSEDKYRNIIENAIEVIFVAQDGRIVFANPKTSQLIGYPTDEILSKPFTEFIHADDREMVIDRHIRRLKGEEPPQQYDFRVVSQDGQIRWVNLNTVAIQWNNRPAILCFLNDITDNKLMQEALRMAEERFRSLIQSMSDLILVVGPDGRFSYESPSVMRVLGYEPGHFIGRLPLEHIHPDDREIVAKDLDDVFRAVNPGVPTTFRYLRADGAWIVLEALGSNQFSTPGIQGVVITARDVTDRKRAETALRESEQRWMFALEGAGDGLWDWNTQTDEVFFSGQWKAMLGYGEGEIANRLDEWDLRIHPEDKAHCYEDLNRHFRGETSFYLNEHRVLCKDGTYKWILDRGKVITWTAEGKPLRVIGTHTDISQRKLMEASLLKSEAEKRGILDSVSDLIFYIDKDMRVIYTNQAMRKFFNVNGAHIEGTLCYRTLHHRDNVCRPCPAFRAMDSGEPQEAYVSSYGRHWRLRGYPVRDEDGGIIGAIEVASDITELRNTEEKYRSIFDNALEGIYQTTPDGRLISANPAMARIFGYDSPESMIKKVRHVGHDLYANPENREILIHQLKEKGIANDFEFEGRRQDGEFIYLSSNARAVKDKQGNTLYHEGIIQDITERKWALEALQASEELYRNIFDHHVAVKLILDPDTGQIIDANESASRYYGWSREQLRQMNIQQINTLTPEAVGQAMERARQAQREQFEFRHRRSDGSVREVEVYSSRIEVKGKTLLHSIIHDVTERKLAQAALQESEERFRALSENAPDIIYTMSLDGAITYVNPSWKRILGHDEKDLLGRYFIDFAKEEDKRTYRKLFKSIRDEGKIVSNYIGVILTRDGKERMFNMNSSFNRDSQGRIIGVVGSLKDITEQAEMEKKLSHAQKMEAIGTLAGGIAHDFNNLLMGIQGYASLMLLDLDASHPHHERLKRIEEQVQSGANLTRQLLGFARGGRYEIRPTDMNDIIVRTSNMFGRTKKEIVIHTSLAQDLWSVEVDRGQMDQMLMNLYLNAWQAMPGGGELYLETLNVLLSDDLGMSYSLRPGPYVKISITDTGVGMDAKTRERIFDPFFTTKAMGRGTGLGLAMVYGIVKGHGGMIEVVSELGQGTTFEIYLPSSDKPIAVEKHTTIQVMKGKETLLLVDDEQMILEVTRDLLESMGYRIYSAGSGQEAVAVYMEKRNEIDLVILDMIMPGMQGGEVFDRLREINPQVRVLLSSGYSIDGQAQKIIERGCNGFLQKPFQLEKISKMIRELLDKPAD